MNVDVNIDWSIDFLGFIRSTDVHYFIEILVVNEWFQWRFIAESEFLTESLIYYLHY